jgi:SNF2 family DNA or RNA helicase
MITAELLEEVIDNATEQSLKKAERILAAKRVFELRHDKETDEITAKVYSESNAGIYDVKISLLEDYYEATCSCAYTWDNDCKHILAVALAARQKQVFIKLPLLQKESSVRVSQPWATNIQYMMPRVSYAFYHYHHKIEITALADKGFIVKYINPNAHQNENIKFEAEGDDLVITGNSVIRQNKLSDAMAATIHMLSGTIGGIDNIENFVASAIELKANVQEPLLKEYKEYVKETDLLYEVKQGRMALVMKDSSLILPPHLTSMANRTAGNILSDHGAYNKDLLGVKAIGNDWGYGFFIVNKDEGVAPIIKPLKGKWDKTRQNFKNSIIQINLSDNSSDIETHDSDFLQLAFQCRQILRYNKMVRKQDYRTDPLNSEPYQAFASIHETLLKLIPQFSKYPLYFTNYLPSHWETNLRKNDTHLCRLDIEPVKLKINCHDGSKYFECDIELKHNDEELDINECSFFSQYFIKHNKDNVIYHLATAAETWLLQELMIHKKLRTPLKLKEQFINSYLIPISKKVSVTYDGQPLVQQETKHELTSTKLYLSELGENILLQPHLVYGSYEVELFSDEEYVKDEKGDFLHLIRQKETEDELKQFFISLHPQFQQQIGRGFLYLHYTELLNDGWFMDLFEKLGNRNIEVLGFNKLTKLKYNPNKPSIQIKVGSGIDWFDIKIKVEFGNQVADLKEIRKAVLRKEQYVTLSDGSIGILPQEWIAKYSRYFGAGEMKKDGLQISKFQFTLLDDFDDTLIDMKTLKELQQKRKRLQEFEEIKEVKVPPGLKANLRDYQQHGLAWLNFLDEFGWGGCLADDMGLGKTVQCIGFLLDQIKKYPKKANLVVMPTTLLFNWEQELKKFAPAIKYHVHYGADRDEKLLGKSGTHLILTSYGTLVRDIEIFKEIIFNYVILDESQAIKNATSQRYRAMRQLIARNRIAMSGTPVENNTMELYAQMHFLNPGIFGSVEGFRKDYATAIDKEGNIDAANRLRKIIKPFLIRRTKEQVAKELPGKTEMTLFCEMGEQQRKVYEAFKEKIRIELLRMIEEEGMNKARFAILDGLLKLRQICNSPKLLNTTEDYGSDSIKADELIRSIREKTGQHKVLVFSQFLGMLDIIRKALEKENIVYEYLDGQSKKRKESVENFQNNESCRVFLISLKAGGTGLNLTAADYVYIVDPWWNPAVEDQAIDRTYRIGQEKKVFAYRMICHNTIEEKILALQEKKKVLVKDIIGVDEGFVKALSKEDVMNLLV